MKDSHFYLFSVCYFFTQYSGDSCDGDVCGKWQDRATEDMRRVLVLANRHKCRFILVEVKVLKECWAVMETKLWFFLSYSLTSFIPVHGASLPTVEMSAEAKRKSWKELNMCKHHTVTLMQLSKQSTKATVGLVLPVMKKKKSSFLLGVFRHVNTRRTKIVFLFISAGTGKYMIH